jgi:hypothetical protein
MSGRQPHWRGRGGCVISHPESYREWENSLEARVFEKLRSNFSKTLASLKFTTAAAAAEGLMVQPPRFCF